MSGDKEAVRVWRVEDRKQVARMEVNSVRCLAVSVDNQRVAAGTSSGDLFVWDMTTHEKVFTVKESACGINGVDFSPINSSRLVSASRRSTAIVWDVAARTSKRKPVVTFRHQGFVTAVKYSPQGDRIVTADPYFIQIWESNNGRLLVDIPVGITPSYNTGLSWFNDHLFVVSDDKIKKLDASKGSTISQWPIPTIDHFSCISPLKSGQFIAYSTKRVASFWDTQTHTRLSLIPYPQDIRSIALSPDDRFLAICGKDGKISIKSLSRIAVSIVPRWTVFHLVFNLNPLFTPHFLGTRLSDRQRCAQFMEAWSSRRCGGVIDRNDPRVFESQPPCTC